MKSSARAVAFLVAALFMARVAFGTEAPATGAKTPAAKKVAGKKLVILVADKLNLKELNDPRAFPNFRKAAAQGALGLMVTGTPMPQDIPGAYASIGAGGPVIGSPDAGYSFNIGRLKPLSNGKTVNEEYTDRMSGAPPALDSDTVLDLALPPLLHANEISPSTPGALGQILWDNGYTSCVFGNADFADVPHREAALMTMNRRGETPHGDVDWESIRDVRVKYPFSASPDLSLLKEAYAGRYKTIGANACDLVVIEFGDTSRAEADRQLADEATARTAKRRALERLDNFLGYIMSTTDLASTQIMLLSPTPPDESFTRNETMTPLLVIGGGIKHGLLTSSTTRGRGIVSNMDIAPHALAFFGIAAPAYMTGGPLASRAGGDSVAELLRTQFMDAMRLRMGRMQQVALILSLLALALAYLAIIRMPRVPRDWQITLGVCLSISGALFAALLLSSVVFTKTYDALPGGFIHYISYFAGFALLIGLSVSFIRKAEWRALAFVILYLVLLAADVLSGGFFSRDSVMMSSPQTALRFYGVQNALAGLLIGAMLAGAGLALDVLLREKIRIARWPLLLLLLAVAAIIGLPNLGSNTGGLLAACAAFSLLAVLVFRKSFKWSEALIAGVATAVVFALFSLAAYFMTSGAHSPFSRTLGYVQSAGDPLALARIALTRVAGNLRMLRQGGSWSAFFAVLFFITASLYYFPNHRVETLFRHFRFLNLSLLAALGGATVAFGITYPGVIAAAGILFIPVLSVLILSINPSQKHAADQKNQKKTSARVSVDDIKVEKRGGRVKPAPGLGRLDGLIRKARKPTQAGAAAETGAAQAGKPGQQQAGSQDNKKPDSQRPTQQGRGSGPYNRQKPPQQRPQGNRPGQDRPGQKDRPEGQDSRRQGQRPGQKDRTGQDSRTGGQNRPEQGQRPGGPGRPDKDRTGRYGSQGKDNRTSGQDSRYGQSPRPGQDKSQPLAQTHEKKIYPPDPGGVIKMPSGPIDRIHVGEHPSGHPYKTKYRSNRPVKGHGFQPGGPGKQLPPNHPEPKGDGENK